MEFIRESYSFAVAGENYYQKVKELAMPIFSFHHPAIRD